MEETTPRKPTGKTWLVSLTSLVFILLQSACTAVMAISGVRVVIGLGALAAATVGVNGPATGWHQNAIRIPMLTIAVLGSVINLYVLWRVRSLRARPASQWRVSPATAKQLRSERIQYVLAYLTLALVATEAITHHIIHHGH